VQKGKARSVADLLGLGIIIPESVRHAARKSPATWALIEQRDTLLLEIQNSSPDRRILLRHQIDSLQRQMKELPELNQILALQLGWPLNLERLQALFSAQWTLAKVNVVMVDWVSLGNHKLMMLVVDKRLKPEVYNLDIDITQVKSWITDKFSDPDMRDRCLDEDVDDPDAVFRQLDPLIAPLQKCTEPKDLLVFSATAPLHLLPLHALKLCEDDRQITLIERNPVVYCPGLTIYEQCVAKALHTLTQSPSANVDHNLGNKGVRLAAVYDVADENAHWLPERDAIYTHMQRLASRLSPTTPPLCGAEVTQSRFREFVDDADLIHFHGHCNFDAGNILQQRLVLARKKDDAAPAAISTPAPALSLSLTSHPAERKKEQLFLLHTNDNNNYFDTNDEDAESLTAREIFSLSLASSPHVTLIACDSAMQNIGPGDEPLGIATAFLCAGAASFMGTLWSMPSREGRAFSDSFYASFHEQSGEEYVDLALALQSAVLNIMRDTRSRSFRYWAPLVLHGAWFCKRFD
jgi:CHAT domain-containing protein